MEGISHPNLDGYLTVNDTGGRLAQNSIDVYVGEGDEALRFYRAIAWNLKLENTPVYIAP